MINLEADILQDVKVWYYKKDSGQKFGPFSDRELIKLIEQEILVGTDDIWMVDLDEWISIRDSVYAYFLK